MLDENFLMEQVFIYYLTIFFTSLSLRNYVHISLKTLKPNQQLSRLNSELYLTR
jgi:hypothetical protein